MATSREERQARTAKTTAKLNDDDELELEYRRTGNTYGKVKPLWEQSSEGVRKTARAAKIKKELENKSLSDVERERLQAEASELDGSVIPTVVAMLDWLAPTDENEVRPVVDWEFYADKAHTQKIPFTRAALESELEPAEIIALAHHILGALNAGESKPSS
jgi:hypothetical protein